MKQYLLVIDGDADERTFTNKIDDARFDFEHYSNTTDSIVEVGLTELEDGEYTTLDSRFVAAANQAACDLWADVASKLRAIYGDPSDCKYFKTPAGTLRLSDHSGNPDKNGWVALDVVIADFDRTEGRFNSTSKGLRFTGADKADVIVGQIVALCGVLYDDLDEQ